MMKASIETVIARRAPATHCECFSALPPRARPGHRSGGLFLLVPVEQDKIVGPLHDLHLLGYAPGQRLLMERDVGPILVLADLVALLDHLVALRLIAFDQDLADQLFDLRIAVIAQIVVAATADF